MVKLIAFTKTLLLNVIIEVVTLNEIQ